MADLSEKTPGEILADSSVAEFIKELGLGIAAAQTALDDNSVRQIEVFTQKRDDLGGRTLLDLGLSPAFYHYQHADITCSMQVRMEVGKSDEFGFGLRGDFKDGKTASAANNASTTTTTSGSRTETKSAKLSMRADSTAVLTIANGATVTPTGDTPNDRLKDLLAKLKAGTSGIDTLIATPPTNKPTITLKSATDKVVVASPMITFLRPEEDNAIIRIKKNENTNFVVNNSLTVTTTAKADIDTYVAHVKDQFTTAGFANVVDVKPGADNSYSLRATSFDTGSAYIAPATVQSILGYARTFKALGIKVEVEGFTDRQGPQSRNIPLGEARAQALYDIFLAAGYTGDDLKFATPKSEGEKKAEAAGDANGKDNPSFRTAKVKLLNLTDRLLLISQGPNFLPDKIAPKQIGGGASGPDNAYVALFDKVPLGIGGNGVVVDGTNFDFNGAAVTGGPAAGTGEAHAHNLAKLINASSTHRASNSGPIVRVSKVDDTYAIQLFATTANQLQIGQSSGFTVTENFTSTSSRVQQRDQNANRSIAVGVSIDGRFSRQFNLQATGNSTISARLVSVPAPAEFLEQIKDYQNEINS